MNHNKSMKLPIIILNWNGFNDTQECINSILAKKIKNITIYLIDNGSETNDTQAIHKYYDNNPSIKIIYNSKNLGYTKAHNLVLKDLIKEGSKFIFLLNNDTIASSKSLSFLLDNLLKINSDIISCKLIKYHQKHLMDTAGHKMLSSGEIIPIGHNNTIDKYNSQFENIGASSGAALYSTEMLTDIGIFDEYFETGYEDAELGLRAYIAGYKSYYEPQAIFYHKIGQSLKKVFDYNYALKAQINIYYTYLKLVHWQLIIINLIPWILRHLVITFIGVICFRFTYLKIIYSALAIILFKDFKIVLKARKNSTYLRRIAWWKLLIKQEFFLKHDIQKLYKYIIKGEKSYFENY